MARSVGMACAQPSLLLLRLLPPLLLLPPLPRCQVLGTQASVLRDVFLTRQEGGEQVGQCRAGSVGRVTAAALACPDLLRRLLPCRRLSSKAAAAVPCNPTPCTEHAQRRQRPQHSCAPAAGPGLAASAPFCGAPLQGPADLSILFAGHGLREVCLFLRWLYSPHLAAPSSEAGAEVRRPAPCALAECTTSGL